LVIWNNHESNVLRNGRVKCVKNQGKNGECMHMKCKFVVTVQWNNFARIKFTSTNHMLPNMGNIISLWKLHSIFEMLAQSPRLA
jgi:hypothetical protein